MPNPRSRRVPQRAALPVPSSAINRSAMNTSHTIQLIRFPLFALVATLLAFGAASCGRKSGTTGGSGKGAAAGDPVEGDWLIIHSLSDPEDLNYLTSTDAGAQEIH